MLNWLKNNQQKIAVIIGYLLVGLLFFTIGKLSNNMESPAIKITGPPADFSQLYDTLKIYETQGETVDNGQATSTNQAQVEECKGQIKGNISSSEKIYHVPGGAFYNRVDPELCFDTEAEAQAAGFRKSKI